MPPPRSLTLSKPDGAAPGKGVFRPSVEKLLSGTPFAPRNSAVLCRRACRRRSMTPAMGRVNGWNRVSAKAEARTRDERREFAVSNSRFSCWCADDLGLGVDVLPGNDDQNRARRANAAQHELRRLTMYKSVSSTICNRVSRRQLHNDVMVRRWLTSSPIISSITSSRLTRPSAPPGSPGVCHESRSVGVAAPYETGDHIQWKRARCASGLAGSS